MALTPVRLTDEVSDLLRSRAAECGVTPLVLGAQLITEYLTQPNVPPVTPPAGPPSLAEAAEVLLNHLEPEHQQLVREFCVEFSRRPSDYLLSYARLAYDRRESQILVGRHLLHEDTGPLALTPAEKVAKCEFCGQTFERSRVGQRFCPDPDDGSESCGRKQTQRESHERREARRRRDTSAFTPPQYNLAALTRAKVPQPVEAAGS